MLTFRFWLTTFGYFFCGKRAGRKHSKIAILKNELWRNLSSGGHSSVHIASFYTPSLQRLLWAWRSRVSIGKKKEKKKRLIKLSSPQVVLNLKKLHDISNLRFKIPAKLFCGSNTDNLKSDMICATCGSKNRQFENDKLLVNCGSNIAIAYLSCRFKTPAIFLFGVQHISMFAFKCFFFCFRIRSINLH